MAHNNKRHLQMLRPAAGYEAIQLAGADVIFDKKKGQATGVKVESECNRLRSAPFAITGKKSRQT